MLVNVLIPGAANFQYLVPHLAELGVLNSFMYSHKLSSTPESLGLQKGLGYNFWPKEYLTQGHMKLIGWYGADTFLPLYYRLWEMGVLRNLRPAPVTHLLLWGAGRQILKRVRADKGVSLGLVANSHPTDLNNLLSEEADSLGIKPRIMPRLRSRVLEEIDLCDHFHAESQFTRNSFIKNGFPADRIHVVSPGKDLNRFSPPTQKEADQRKNDKRFRVICVGALSLRKGQVHLLEAWRKLRLQNAELVLVGSETRDMRPLFAKYAGEFTYIRRAPELRPLLINSSIMVLPSIEDGHAHVVGEALACGLPVITTVNTGSADYIKEGINGYVVPVASAQAIAEKLLVVYENPDLLESLHQGAQATIKTIGSWRDNAVKLAALYRKLAADGG
jgi:glycosyltransferase involved in cell wall biosynthesis